MKELRGLTVNVYIEGEYNVTDNQCTDPDLYHEGWIHTPRTRFWGSLEDFGVIVVWDVYDTKKLDY